MEEIQYIKTLGNSFKLYKEEKGFYTATLKTVAESEGFEPPLPCGKLV